MHLADPIFIFILALVLLGPKKTAELAQQLGKLMGEFRKASNDFKFQFNEEMRISEQQEQQKKQDAERAGLTAGGSSAEGTGPEGTGAEVYTTAAEGEAEGENTILAPGLSAGESEHPASEPVPYAVSATTGEEQPVEDHPLLRVDVIPPMDGTPADQTSATAVTPVEHSGNGNGAKIIREEDRAPVHRG